MKKIPWELISDDKRVKFDLVTMYKEDEEVTSTGLLLFDGKKKATCEFVTPDIFTLRKKPKKPGKMVAYSLAYHLAVMVTGGERNKARELVEEWLGADGADIRKAVRVYSPKRNAVIMAVAEPFGIIVMHDPGRVKVVDNKMSYSGLIWAWKHGDNEALIGQSVLKDLEAPFLINSPLLEKNKNI
jgi:hypothetical protein